MPLSVPHIPYPSLCLGLIALLSGTACGPQNEEQSARFACHVLDPDRGAGQFGFLDAAVGDARIVQLGENTHGVKDYTALKTSAIGYLHAQMGFDVIAFESAVYQCDESDRHLAERPAQTSLLLCVYGVWHTPEMLDLFDYIAASQSTDRPIRIAGFDIQPIGPNKTARPDFLSTMMAKVAPEEADALAQLDQDFLEIYASGNRNRRTFFRSSDGAAMASQYDAASDRLALMEEPDRDQIIARMTLRSMAAYIRQQSAPDMASYAERRDLGMAQNLIDIGDRLYPDRKIVVWGHNAHIRHANADIEPHPDAFPGVRVRLAGSDVRDHYGADVYTVGFYAAEGQAMNNRGAVFDIAAPDVDSLEARLAAVPGPAAFVDLDQAREAASLAWTQTPISARFNAQTPLIQILPDQFDGVVVVDIAHPRGTLSSDRTGKAVAQRAIDDDSTSVGCDLSGTNQP